VAPLFKSTGGDGSSAYTYANALAGSGFFLDLSSGVLSGTPTETDLLARQPLKIQITADSNGTQSTVEFLVFVSKGAKRPPARPHGEAALATAMIGAAFRLNASDFLVVQETDEGVAETLHSLALLSPLPEGSGLRFLGDKYSASDDWGILQGTPNAKDGEAEPFRLVFQGTTR
jgi:hypothetical protein